MSSPPTGQPSQAKAGDAKPARRFAQLPIGLNQCEPMYSIKFQGEDDDPGVSLYKFLRFGNCGGPEEESEEARYCVGLNKPLGPGNSYGYLVHKMEWPAYKPDRPALCFCYDTTTRYELGHEIALDWCDYLAKAMRLLDPEASVDGRDERNPVVGGIEFKQMYLSEFYANDWREWESKIWVELPDGMENLDFLVR
ncbi:uncharacterized protein B0H18DRAFT_955671 [Fomitopsis serialis]|uniref:uncharacterized protein n=1 Tax=Fomitopsis serialis TaxID=139415 RepID=UPI0020082766|nr:uncharacterized protein B0H18DRAFT_955671 [Neoantrodia serialis]KAH9923813.1 hypothetical protein B0H18DRAFT_955671 [Neoantrodia serialis]